MLMIIQIWYQCSKCNSAYLKTANKDSDIFTDMKCVNYPRCDGILELKH